MCCFCSRCGIIAGANDKDFHFVFVGVCNHAFHFHCISRWLKTRQVCPLGMHFKFFPYPSPTISFIDFWKFEGSCAILQIIASGSFKSTGTKTLLLRIWILKFSWGCNGVVDRLSPFMISDNSDLKMHFVAQLQLSR